ncbi:MAG: universal stress protein [Roseobacter sp.]|jgi:nucleotide-binding universal stress UspA family protein|nr:universal stress protein [Roseobacter sp.]
MSYKTVFTALSRLDETPAALAFSAALTDAQDAHLEVLSLGIDRTPNTYYEIGSNAMVMHAAIEEAHAQVADIQSGVRAFLDKTNLRWDVINSVTSAAGVGRTVAMQARLADVAVVGLPYGPESAPEDSLILEGLLFEARCPTIVVPEGCDNARPKSILIGWNESAEAIRAVRAAMPLLQKAEAVHLAIIDPPETGPERSDPGGALAVYLSRHGVRCDIQVMTRQGLKVSERLSQHVTETGSDLLVMGGYGHSRFREAVLGGATREMLQSSKVPVLMAH